MRIRRIIKFGVFLMFISSWILSMHADAIVKSPFPDDANGRWIIPEVGVDVACYSSIAQSVCDADNSACLFNWEGQTLIADHWYQGFQAIKRCKEGMIAYLETDKGVKEYICTGIINGHNTVNQLTDENNYSIADKNVGGITCYTCNYHWKNVTIVFFQPIS